MKNLEKLDISVLNSYPTPDESAVDQLLSEEFKDFNKKVVVLDDDPTGTQTVHDVPVFTDWTQATFENGLKDEHSMFFILTNSRSFSKDETIAVHTDIAKNLAAGRPGLFSGLSFDLPRRLHPSRTFSAGNRGTEKYIGA